MNVRHKLRRFALYSRHFGVLNALSFSLQWTLRRPVVSLRVAPGRTVRVRRWGSDLSVLEAIYIEREFALEAPVSGLIIDGGANIGLSTLYLADHNPDALVVAVEPSGENLSLLRRNCAGLGNVAILHAGLWTAQARLRIANPDEQFWAFQCEAAEPDDPGGFDAVTIDDLIDRYGQGRCALLKLDIEGAEEALFRARGGWLGRTDRILVETHGAAARAALDEACPAHAWSRRMLGEKDYLIAREAAG